MHFVRIAAPFTNDEDLLHCPAYGTSIHDPESGCPHLLFVYYDEADDFHGVALPLQGDVAAVKAERDGLEDEAWDEADPSEMLARRLDRSSAVCFRFGANTTGGGYAVGFDFAP